MHVRAQAQARVYASRACREIEKHAEHCDDSWQATFNGADGNIGVLLVLCLLLYVNLRIRLH